MKEHQVYLTLCFAAMFMVFLAHIVQALMERRKIHRKLQGQIATGAGPNVRSKIL